MTESDKIIFNRMMIKWIKEKNVPKWKCPNYRGKGLTLEQWCFEIRDSLEEYINVVVPNRLLSDE